VASQLTKLSRALLKGSELQLQARQQRAGDLLSEPYGPCVIIGSISCLGSALKNIVAEVRMFDQNVRAAETIASMVLSARN